MNEDFTCPFCKSETKPLNEEMLNSDTRYINLTKKQSVYCKKHNFLLFEERIVGGGFFKEGIPEWFFLKKLEPTDFTCGYCVYWNLKKGREDEEGINKTCELGLQKGRQYEDMNFCKSCTKFKYKGEDKK